MSNLKSIGQSNMPKLMIRAIHWLQNFEWTFYNFIMFIFEYIKIQYNSRQNKLFPSQKMRVFKSLLRKTSINSSIIPSCLLSKQRDQQNSHKKPSTSWKNKYPTRKLTHRSKVLAKSQGRTSSKRRCMMWSLI